jgi:hypothetical protein
MLELAQLFHVPQVHPQFDISPDDIKLSFAWNKTGEWQIYEIVFPSPNGRGVRAKSLNSPLEQAESSTRATHPMARVLRMY